MSKIVTFGEIMLRLATPDYNTINQTRTYLANYGGGEANVSVSLAHLGDDTKFLSKLPNSELGDGAISYLRGQGVDTSSIILGGDNLGIYFLETGFGGRASKVIYNRKNSAINTISIYEVNYDTIFKDANWLHCSGINLALSDNVRKFTINLCKEAKKRNITVSFDFNYRTKLLSLSKAKECYKEILEYVDVVFASFYDANTIIGIPLDPKLENASLSEKRRNVFPKLIEKYHLKYIFGTDRIVYSSLENSLAGYYYGVENGLLKWHLTEPIRFNIYDRIGGGDAFASGVIHELLRDFKNPLFALNFGLNTSVLKHTIYGDSCLLNEEDILRFMSSQNGEVIR